jgi:hypothetical protein
MNEKDSVFLCHYSNAFADGWLQTELGKLVIQRV